MKDIKQAAHQLTLNIEKLQDHEVTNLNRLLENYVISMQLINPNDELSNSPLNNGIIQSTGPEGYFNFEEKADILRNVESELEGDGFFINYSPYQPKTQSEHYVANFTLGKATLITLRHPHYADKAKIGDLLNDTEAIYAFDNELIYNYSLQVRISLDENVAFSTQDLNFPLPISAEDRRALAHTSKELAKSGEEITLENKDKYNQANTPKRVIVSIDSKNYFVKFDDKNYLKLLKFFESDYRDNFRKFIENGIKIAQEKSKQD